MTCALVAGGLAVPAVPTRAQPATLRVELAGTAGTPWVEDGNGVTVRQGIGAAVSVAIALRPRAVAVLRTSLAPLVTVRGSTSPLRAARGDDRWRAGRARHIDVSVGGQATFTGLGDVSSGLVISRVSGPSDVAPFRGDGAIGAWGLEAAISRSFGRRSPLRGVVGVHGLRFPAQRGSDPTVAAGWVGRIRLGIQYAR